MAIAYLGPEATNTHAAALQHYGSKDDYEPQLTISLVFEAVARGSARAGVVPIENSIQGVVRETIDCLLTQPVMICGELELGIKHTLMGPRGLSPQKATRVASHPQALAQCRLWLERNHPHLLQTGATSTSAAAREAQSRTDTLAIAPPLAAQRCGLAVIEQQVSDRPDNATRFICIANQDADATGRDRTTLVFTTPHQRGALRAVLEIFDDAGVNMTRIESRPLSGKLWEYAFVVDVEGHRHESPVREALAALERGGNLIKVLGSYPRA